MSIPMTWQFPRLDLASIGDEGLQQDMATKNTSDGPLEGRKEGGQLRSFCRETNISHIVSHAIHIVSGKRKK